MNTEEVSFIIPVYNESGVVKDFVTKLKIMLDLYLPSVKIIISEDGSTDGTKELSTQLVRDDPEHILFLYSDIRHGKGWAISRAISQVKGEIAVVMDADSIGSISYLPLIVQEVKKQGGMVIASRNTRGAICYRPFMRKLSSKVYNSIARLLFRDGISDHQVGFKALDRKIIDSVIPNIKSVNFFWDTETLVRAKKQGYKITEIPITWTETNRKSKFFCSRNVLMMLISLVKFRFELIWEVFTKTIGQKKDKPKAGGYTQR